MPQKHRRCAISWAICALHDYRISLLSTFELEGSLQRHPVRIRELGHSWAHGHRSVHQNRADFLDPGIRVP